MTETNIQNSHPQENISLVIPYENQGNFDVIYDKSYRLAAAIFMVCQLMDEKEELRTKIKKLSLDMVSLSVKLKDIGFVESKKVMIELEKNSLELVSLLDIASLSGLISKMNGDIIKQEFQSFILTISQFSKQSETDRAVSVKKVLDDAIKSSKIDNQVVSLASASEVKNILKVTESSIESNGNGNKRKDLRKNMILDFIKRHGEVSIKDIVPNIIGCSEKTIQRELLGLINEGKIVKNGERRWSKYKVV